MKSEVLLAFLKECKKSDIKNSSTKFFHRFREYFTVKQLRNLLKVSRSKYYKTNSKRTKLLRI